MESRATKLNCTLLLLLTALACLYSGQACEHSPAYDHYIYIDPNNGSDSPECLGNDSFNNPCRHLVYALQNKSRQASTQFVLRNGTHILNYTAQFTNTVNISLVGDSETDTIVICDRVPHKELGLGFVNVTNIYLENITFLRCGTHLVSANEEYKRVFASLHFYECRDICMLHTTVNFSSNAFGVSLYNVRGINVIESSDFCNNVIENTVTYSGGGGFRAEFTTNQSNTSELNFIDCMFYNNSAQTRNSSANIPLKNRKYLGHGGGLALTFRGEAGGICITVSNCLFVQNKAISGGGLLALFQERVASNSLMVENSCFEENSSPYNNTIAAGGGALRIDHGVTEDIQAAGNDIHIKNCTFTKNHAATGGALSIVPALQSTNKLNLASINIIQCTFDSNTGHVGAAIEVTQLPFVTEGMGPHILFSQLVLTGNKAVSENPQDMYTYETGFAAMYISRIKVQFRDNVTFENNTGSALGAVGTYLDFMHCSAEFKRNHGSKGGAISLLGSATILINDSTNMTFIENSADVFGGAINNRYTEKDLLNYKKCFIHHDTSPTDPNSWYSQFHFVNNTAKLERGNSIYTTSLYPCSYYDTVNKTFRKWKNWNFEPGDSEEIASDGGKVTVGSGSISVYPGQRGKLSLSVVDDLQHNMSNLTVFMASVNDTNIATVDPGFTYISADYIKILGKENTTVQLTLSSVSDREWHIHFQVNISACPLGFTSDNSSTAICKCREQKFNKKLKCDEIEFTSSFENGYWIGMIEKDNKSILTVALCHFHFCSFDLEDTSQKLPTTLDKNICFGNRQGVLCGECEDTYGPVVNNEDFQCVRCNSSRAGDILKYVSSVYIPLTIVFILIIILNVRLTTGPANAFIFYAQIVSSTFDLYADGHTPLPKLTQHDDYKHIKNYLNSYRIPYGLFNLEFIENYISDLCLGTRFNVLDVLQLDYLVALFPLLLIIALTICVNIKGYFAMKRGKSSCTVIRNSLMHAFAAFLLLSYVKFALTSTYIVNSHPLYDENYTVVQRRVYFAGKFQRTDTLYLLQYYIPAIVVLIVFVGLPPVILLGFPVRWFEKVVCRVPCCKRIYSAGKMRIFLDVFQGCYKNNMRFFASMYFFFRLFINVSFILTDTWLQQYVVQQIACTVFILIIAMCWPYKHNFQNYVDLLIFIDLAIVNAISFYLYANFTDNPHGPLPVGFFVIQLTLVLLPLLYMILYIMWYFCKPSPEKLKECIDNSFLSPLLKYCMEVESSSSRGRRRRESYQSLDADSQLGNSHRRVTMTEVTLASAVASSPQSEIEEILHRAEDGNTYKPLPQKGSINGGDALAKDSGLNTHSRLSDTPVNNYGASDSGNSRITSVEIHDYI